MSRKFVITGVILSMVAIAFAACMGSSAKEQKDEVKNDRAQMIKKGEYLVSIAGCDDCHSPKRMGLHGPEIIPELRLSGYPSDRPVQKADSNVIKQGWVLFGPDLTSAVGPWGMSFAANITSDSTGIGNWKEENFIRAIRHGKFKGLEEARALLPPMPWNNYKNMSDEDIRSVFAYLQSTKPVHNVVPAPKQLSEIK